jgi:hypothetical protein
LVKSGAHVEPEHVMDTTAETVDKALPKADR